MFMARLLLIFALALGSWGSFVPSAAFGDTGGTGHGGEVGHAAMDEPNPSTLDFPLAIFTVVVFAATLTVLWKFAWGPIQQGLERREERVAETLNQAERLQEEAKALMAQYEKRMAEAQDEVRAILEEARRDAEHAKQQTMAETEREIQALRDRATRDLETARSQALKDLAERSADLAIDLAGRMIHKQLSRADHSELIDEALERFPTKT